MPTWRRVLDAVLEHIPAPDGDPDAPLQALVTNLDASDYLGRLAIGRVVQGTLRSGEPMALLTEEYEEGEAPIVRRPSQVLAFAGIARADVEVLKAGDLFVIAGYPGGRDRRHLRRARRSQAPAPPHRGRAGAVA